MNPTPAFATAAATTSFTGNGSAIAATRPSRAIAHTKPVPTRRAPRMADDGKKGFFSNPFAKKPASQEPSSAFMQPQPGDPGYKPLPPVPKGFGMTKSEKKTEKKGEEDAPAQTKGSAGAKGGGKSAKGVGKTAKDLPVMAGNSVAGVKRGLDLLREDLLKSAPEKAGVGRQDREAVTMRPVAGEPGYKPPSFQTVKVSELGISPFPDDANAVGKVGGIDAVKKAAVNVKKGMKAKEIKKLVLDAQNEVSDTKKIKEKVKKVAVKAKETTDKAIASVQSKPKPMASMPPTPQAFDIPDYLKAIPEDTPRRGMTWKNYNGR